MVSNNFCKMTFDSHPVVNSIIFNSIQQHWSIDPKEMPMFETSCPIKQQQKRRIVQILQ